MGSMGVCLGHARTRLVQRCHLQKQRLCLENSLKTISPTRTYFIRSYSSAIDSQSYLPSNNNRFHTATNARATWRRQYSTPSSTSEPDPARNLQTESEDRSPELDEAVSYVKENQKKTPWQREGSQIPPVKRDRNASAMTKGKLLTTPSRLLKLILPVTTKDYNDDRKDVEPLALLLHSQQPLSYLERLIQAEVPPITDEKGKLRPPHVFFLAVEIEDGVIQPRRPKAKTEVDDSAKDEDDASGTNEEKPLVATKDSQIARLRNIPDENDRVTKDLDAARQSETDTEIEALRKGSFVRWSSSTEIGEFIRDAARVKEFLIEIENSPLGKIPVAVPSFNDRTYYLRMRLRKLSKNLKNLAIIKQECDVLAHRGAQRVALGGLGVMVSWWCIVYKLTFETDYGWDTMEPITYLVSLSTLVGGYAWFLYHNREISYRSALDFTVNRRQQKLYHARGIDLQLWESLIEEANALRREIKTVAEEYDVDWDERADEEDERVTEALKHDRRQKERKDEAERKQGKEDGGKEKD